MKADDLIKRYPMKGHVEEGLFMECHYADEKGGRADSGSIYYYTARDEKTKFHVIDCDEYWLYNAGSDLQVWLIREDGRVEIKRLGVGEGAEPLIYVRKGLVFSSRHDAGAEDGTFLTCITVPRFDPQAFVMYEKDEVLEKWPDAAPFWDD